MLSTGSAPAALCVPVSAWGGLTYIPPVRRLILLSRLVLSLPMWIGCSERTPEPIVEREPPRPEETTYCVGTVLTKSGVACAGRPLSPEAYAHRDSTSLLRATAGKVTRVERRTGRGGLIYSEELEYEGDAAARITRRSASGAVRWVTHIDRGGTRHVIRDRFGRPKRTSDAAVVEERISFDPRGFPELIQFFDVDGRPTRDEWGAFARRYVRREDGARLESTILDADLRPMVGSEGLATIRYEVNEQGATLTERKFDAEGKPVLGAYGAHWFRATNDEWSNNLGCEFFGLDDEKVLDRRAGFAWKETFDEGGCVVLTERFDAEGRLANGPGGWARATMECDAAGRTIEWKYFGDDGWPRSPLGRAHYTRVRKELDQHGRVVGTRYWDANGEPQRPVAFEGRKLNDDDDPIELWTEGPDGRPVGVRVVARERRSYDGFGQNVATSYFDVDDRPVLGALGYAKVSRRFDDTGKLMEERFTDPSGQPVTVFDVQLLGVSFDTEKGPAAGRSRAEALVVAREALDKIRSGMPFARAVLTYADRSQHASRGRLSKRAASYFADSIRDALVKLKLGDFSDVIETPRTFYIVKRELAPASK